MAKKDKIIVEGTEITIISDKQNDYISLTDMAKYRNADFPSETIQNWMRNRSTVEFLGLWERLYNPYLVLLIKYIFIIFAAKTAYELS